MSTTEIMPGSQEFWQHAAKSWRKVREMLKSLPVIDRPIFPGPVPDAKAPEMAKTVRQQVEPIVVGTDAPQRGSRWSGVPASTNASAPEPLARPKPLILYTRNLPIQPPSRRRVSTESTDSAPE